MDFKLNIETLVETIKEYEKILKVLEEEKEAINNILRELYNGWSGEAKDKFESVHNEKQKLYNELEENIKYIKDVLESEEKPRAIKLKNRCEDYVHLVSRRGCAAETTPDDKGVITMNLSGINAVENIIDNCTDNYNITIRNKLYEIDDILDEFEFTSFGIGGEINESQRSIKEQNNNLSDFRESVSIYNHEVIEMENNTAGKLKMIAGIGEGKEGSENQTEDNTSIEFIPTFSSSVQYIPGQIVKIKGTDGKWYIGTAQVEELVGTGGYRKFKFVPNKLNDVDVNVNIDDLPEYKTGMQFAVKTRVKVKGLDGVWYSGTVTPVKTGECIFVADDVKGYKDATGNGIKYGKTVWNSLWNYAYQTIYGIEDLGISGIEMISKKDLSEYHEIIDEASSTVYNELKKQSPYTYGFDGLNVLINTASIGFGAAGLVKTAAGIPTLIKQGKNIGQIIKNGISITKNKDDFVVTSNGTIAVGRSIPRIPSIVINPGLAEELAGAVSVVGSGAVEMAGNGAIASAGISNIVGGNGDGYEGGSKSNDINGGKRKHGTLTDIEIDSKYNDWSNNLKDNSYTGGRSNKEIQSLAKDPDHVGSNRIIDIEKGMHEAEVGIDLEARGKLKDIVRDPTGDAEFIENAGSGPKWDVKTFNSGFSPKKGGFTLERSMKTINKSLEKGENVIVDTSKLSEEHKVLLLKEIEKQGLMDQSKIKIWP